MFFNTVVVKTRPDIVIQIYYLSVHQIYYLTTSTAYDNSM